MRSAFEVYEKPYMNVWYHSNFFINLFSLPELAHAAGIRIHRWGSTRFDKDTLLSATRKTSVNNKSFLDATSFISTAKRTTQDS